MHRVQYGPLSRLHIPMNIRAGVTAIVLVMVTVAQLTACTTGGTDVRNSQMEQVAKDWSLTTRASQDYLYTP
jgi:hypothetical protein